MYMHNHIRFELYNVYFKRISNSAQTQTTFYFSNHVIMALGNTCTYINDLTNNYHSGDSFNNKPKGGLNMPYKRV